MDSSDLVLAGVVTLLAAVISEYSVWVRKRRFRRSMASDQDVAATTEVVQAR